MTYSSVAANLSASERKNLAIQALVGETSVTDLAHENQVSRKFIYQQAGKADLALDQAFSPTEPDETVLFELPVTRSWLRQMMLGLTLICRSSYGGVVELMRDLLGVSISKTTVHNVHQLAAAQAEILNASQDLSAIRVGANDEIFHIGQPVLTGIDVRSTYCYLLSAQPHRDAETWAIQLMYARDQGFNPDFTIADQGRGLRAGQALVWEDLPCHGDVFHVLQQCETLANTLNRIAGGATTQREKLQGRMQVADQSDHAEEVASALEYERHSQQLARDIRTLVTWLKRDVLALAGPCLAVRCDLYDFIVDELSQRESDTLPSIRKIRVALHNQRDDVLAFAGVLDKKLAEIAQVHQVPEYLVRTASLLHRKPKKSPSYWQAWNRLHAQLGARGHAVIAAVDQAMAQTPRSSSLVENLNSRLRNYFTLRRQLGGSYLSL